jgi:hypothetical protein
VAPLAALGVPTSEYLERIILELNGVMRRKVESEKRDNIDHSYMMEPMKANPHI